MTSRHPLIGRFLFVVVLLFSTCVALPAQATAPIQPVQPAGPAQSDVASYQIEARLDAEVHQVHGRELIVYRNPSTDSLSEVWVHLYLNAMQSADTRWMQEVGGRAMGFDPNAPGWIRVESFTVANGGPALTLESPNDPDQTIARAALPEPLGPGETLQLDVTWTSQLPKVFARTGYSDTFHMVAQWYPKLAVYDRGRWDTEPWHGQSEFFHDYGNYDLTVVVPSGYVTGGNGVRIDEREQDDGTRRARYQAQRVTDTVWTAWPSFVVMSRDVPAAGASVQVEYLFPPDEAPEADRHYDAAQAALDSFGRWYGVYPWPKLTVVVPPRGASGSGGMEYPSLVATGRSVDTPRVLDLSQRLLENVTIHEIAHEWFPMQLASNEAVDAFLDEGFADYLTNRVLDRRYPPERSLFDSPIGRGSWDSERRATLAFAGVLREPLAQPSWNLPFGRYGGLVYAKGSSALHTLEGIYGDDRFTSALRAYADQWRWRHPSIPDFQASLEGALGEPLDWFFDAVVYGDDIVEYGVRGIDGSTATVERLGEAQFPVDIRLTFDDRTAQTTQWSGVESELTLPGTGQRIIRVEIDPDEKLDLELDRTNNVLDLVPDPVPAAAIASRWMALIQPLLRAFGQVG